MSPRHATVRVASFVAATLLSGAACASEMSYRPVNPSFGGNPMNGSYLFGQATAQDRSSDKRNSGSTAAVASRSAADVFKQQLQSRLVSSMANQVVDAIYGENSQQSGHFQFDDLEIAFERVNGEVKVTINDSTGTTVIAVPQPVTIR